MQTNIDNIQAQLDTLASGANDYYIYAPTSGVIHMDTPYKVGMVLSAGSALATVANSTYVVSNSGDKVDLANGMSVTARVEYDKLTYFEYVMEALGVLFR